MICQTWLMLIALSKRSLKNQKFSKTGTKLWNNNSEMCQIHFLQATYFTQESFTTKLHKRVL